MRGSGTRDLRRSHQINQILGGVVCVKTSGLFLPVELVVVLVPLDGVERAALHVELAREPRVVARAHVRRHLDVLQPKRQRA